MHSTLVALSVQRHYFHADPPVITLRNYRIYIPNRNRWIQIGMSGMPQEYRTEGKKSTGINLNTPPRVVLARGRSVRNVSSRFFFSAGLPFFSPCSLAVERSGYQFYRIKTGSSVTPIRSYPRGTVRSIRAARESRLRLRLSFALRASCYSNMH